MYHMFSCWGSNHVTLCWENKAEIPLKWWAIRGHRMLPPPSPDRFPIFLYLSISINHITVLYWLLNMLNCCHSRQDDARGKGSELTCAELVLFFFFFSRLSDSVGPSGKLLQPGGDGARERERAEWRGDALRSVSGFMELCTSDPPPWIAIRDHFFSFYLFYCPAFTLRSPSSIPPMKVSELSVCGHVCLSVCARTRAHVYVFECVWTVRGARRGQCRALTADCPIFNDELMWVWSWRWGSRWGGMLSLTGSN